MEFFRWLFWKPENVVENIYEFTFICTRCGRTYEVRRTEPEATWVHECRRLS